jgi:hypothetical protein
VLTRNGSSVPTASISCCRNVSPSTTREFTRAMPNPENHNTGPCRISLRTVKRGGAATGIAICGGSSWGAGTLSCAASASGVGGAGSGVTAARIASSALVDESARNHGPITSNVSSCSERNHPAVYLRSAIDR